MYLHVRLYFSFSTAEKSVYFFSGDSDNLLYTMVGHCIYYTHNIGKI